VLVQLAAVVAGGMDVEEENSERTNSEVRRVIFVRYGLCRLRTLVI